MPTDPELFEDLRRYTKLLVSLNSIRLPALPTLEAVWLAWKPSNEHIGSRMVASIVKVAGHASDRVEMLALVEMGLAHA